MVFNELESPNIKGVNKSFENMLSLIVQRFHPVGVLKLPPEAINQTDDDMRYMR